MTSDAKNVEASTFEITEPIRSVLVVRLNRPAERNSLSITRLTELSLTLPKLLDSDNVETIIFTGSDDVFASGANIRELAELDAQAARKFAGLGQKLMTSIASARQKTVAAINGYCMGGGLDLALACDVRLASTKATFAHPGGRLGIITGWGGTQRLPRLIGKPRAVELFLTAKTLDAQEALRIGLIDGIVDPVCEAALRYL